MTDESEKVEIVDKITKGHIVILYVKAEINGKTYETNFNEPIDAIESGAYKAHIRKWIDGIKKIQSIDIDQKVPTGQIKL